MSFDDVFEKPSLSGKTKLMTQVRVYPTSSSLDGGSMDFDIDGEQIIDDIYIRAKITVATDSGSYLSSYPLAQMVESATLYLGNTPIETISDPNRRKKFLQTLKSTDLVSVIGSTELGAPLTGAVFQGATLTDEEEYLCQLKLSDIFDCLNWRGPRYLPLKMRVSFVKDNTRLRVGTATASTLSLSDVELWYNRFEPINRGELIPKLNKQFWAYDECYVYTQTAAATQRKSLSFDRRPNRVVISCPITRTAAASEARDATQFTSVYCLIDGIQYPSIPINAAGDITRPYRKLLDIAEVGGPAVDIDDYGLYNGYIVIDILPESSAKALSRTVVEVVASITTPANRDLEILCFFDRHVEIDGVSEPVLH